MLYGGPDSKPFQESAEELSILRCLDRGQGRAEQPHACLTQRPCQPQWRLTTKLEYHALGLLDLEDGEHVLDGQRLEVQSVRGVVVSRDRFRVAVDHHRVSARLSNRHGRVDAAIVELHPLTDAVGARSENYD